jgi:hypothetical protein
MRKFLAFTSLAVLAACSQEPNRQSTQSDLKTYDAEESVAVAPPPMDSRMPRSATSAPGIGVTAAPGVAFNYQYGFSLPSERVAAVQEQHALACEKIGIAQCRITGMLYRRVNEKDIEAMIAFKLDPAIARKFGKDGSDIVDRAEGVVVEVQITGEDAGAAIAQATRSQAEMEEELAKVEAQLARTGVRAAERAELQIRVQQLRDSIRAVRAGKAQQQESLARTPVVFRYGAGDYAPGFEDNAPISSALERSWDNVVTGSAALIVILITLLPWLFVALLFWLGFRAVRRRFFKTRPADAETPVSEA